eukprot:403340835
MSQINDLLQNALLSSPSYQTCLQDILDYLDDNPKNSKYHAAIVAHIKQVIKSKQSTSHQKLLALRLLNQCVLKNAKDFHKVIDKKIIKRLGILAQFNKEKNSEDDMVTKGTFLFSEKEPDKKSSQRFLVYLLDCIERWSQSFPLGEDWKTPTGYMKLYQSLLQKKILFPSQCKSNPLKQLGLEEDNKPALKEISNKQSNGSSNKPSADFVQNLIDIDFNFANKGQKQSEKASQDFPKQIEECKKMAMKSEQIIKKAQKDSEKANPQKLIEMQRIMNELQNGKSKCESCVSQLTQENSSSLVPNPDQTLMELIDYQDIISEAHNKIQSIVKIVETKLKASAQQVKEEIKANNNKQDEPFFEDLNVNYIMQESQNQQQHQHKEEEVIPGINLWKNVMADDFKNQYSVPQPEPEGVSTGANFSLFKMMQEGKLDDEDLNPRKKQVFAQEAQQNYDYDQNGQNNYDFQNYDTSYQQQNNYDYSNQQYQDNYQHNNNDNQSVAAHPKSQDDEKMEQLYKDLDSLKRQLSHQRSTNSHLRDQLRKLQKNNGYVYAAEFQDDYANGSNQSDERINELKEYYEIQMDRKDKIIQSQAQEIQRLNDLTEEMKTQMEKISYNNNYSQPKQQFSPHVNQENDQNNVYSGNFQVAASISPVNMNKDYNEWYRKGNKSENNDIEVVTKYNEKQTDINTKIDNFYFKGLFTDKMIIYEDQYIKIGCVRAVSKEWRITSIKLFVANQDQSQAISKLEMVPYEPQVTLKTQMPIQIDPKDQRDVGISVPHSYHNIPFVQLNYEVGNFQSPAIWLKIPTNVLVHSEPVNMNNTSFQQSWSQLRNITNTTFNLDFQRASNLQQIKKVVTLNESKTTLIRDIEQGKPNIVGIVGQLQEGQFLAQIEISPSGLGCKISVKSEINETLSSTIMSTIIDLISVKEQS